MPANLESLEFHRNTLDISQPITSQEVLPLDPDYTQITVIHLNQYITGYCFKSADLCDQ